MFAFPGIGGKQLYGSLWIINNFSTSCFSWQVCEIFIAFLSKGLRVSFSFREYYSVTQCLSHWCLLQLCFLSCPLPWPMFFNAAFGLTSSDILCCLLFKLLHSRWLLFLWCGPKHIIKHRSQFYKVIVHQRKSARIHPNEFLTLKKWRPSRQKGRNSHLCITSVCERNYASELNRFTTCLVAQW